MLKLGISSYTFTWAVGVPGYPVPGGPLSALGLLHRAKELKVSVLQIADNLPLHLLPPEEVKQLIQQAVDWNIDLEVGTRGVERDLLLTYLDIAKKLGSKFVRTIIHTNSGTPQLSEAIRMIRDIMPAYERDGIVLAIENHDRHTVKELIQVIESVQSPYVGICLDTVNSFGALENPDYVIQSLAPYTVNLHYKDFKISRVQSQMGFSVIGCPAGDGQLDADMIFDVFTEIKNKPNVILELWTPFEHSLESTIAVETEWAEKSIQYLEEKLQCQYNKT